MPGAVQSVQVSIRSSADRSGKTLTSGFIADYIDRIPGYTKLVDAGKPGRAHPCDAALRAAEVRAMRPARGPAGGPEQPADQPVGCHADSGRGSRPDAGSCMLSRPLPCRPGSRCCWVTICAATLTTPPGTAH